VAEAILIKSGLNQLLEPTGTEQTVEFLGQSKNGIQTSA